MPTTDPDKFHHFHVVSRDATSRHASVYMDGVKLKGVKAVRIEMDVDQVNIITITFMAGSINAEAEGEAPSD